MASLSDDVVTGSNDIGIGLGGTNPGGALGKAAGIWDALVFLISLIRATIRFKYPEDTSSRWSRNSASNGFSNALSSYGVHFNMGPSRQVSSSIGASSAMSSIVALIAVSRLGIDVS